MSTGSPLLAVVGCGGTIDHVQERFDDARQSQGSAVCWDDGGRTFWRVERLNDKTLLSEVRRRVGRDEANLVSSLTDDGRHLPAIDVDYRAQLVPSSSPGRFHLYVDVPMSWRAYRRLLRALYLGGVIGVNVYWRSLDREATFLRPPGVVKSTHERLLADPDRREGRRRGSWVLLLVRCRVTVKRVGWNVREAVGFVTGVAGRVVRVLRSGRVRGS